MSTMLSDRLKLALTIATAITLAYAIAMWMDWQRPYWAGFAVAMVSLATVGESVFKAMQRLAGTAVAVVAAIFFISQFAQERWAFVLATSLWISLCVWRMLNDEKHYYFWFCCAYITPLLSIMSGFDSAQSFYTVETRAKETVLGIICYIVVALLFSTRRAEHRFVGDVGTLLDKLRRQCGHAENLARHGGYRDVERSIQSSEDIAAILARLSSLKVSAMLETFHMRERTDAWDDVLARLTAISRSLDRFVYTYDDNAAAKEAPNSDLADALAQISHRLAFVEALFASPNPVELSPPETIARIQIPQGSHDPFQAGEHALRSDLLETLNEATLGLRSAAIDITDGKPLEGHRLKVSKPTWRTILPDPEHLSIILLMMMVVWSAFLLYIYVPALPDGPVIIVISVVIGVNLARVPWTPAIKLLLPATLACAYGFIAHVFIMPHLSGFSQLGAMLFSGVFIIAWLFHTEQAQVGRFLGTALFLMCLQISNANQTYSATYSMNIFIAYAVVFLLITMLQRVPFSWQPQNVVPRLLRRYANSLMHVLDEMSWDKPLPNSWLSRQIRGYHHSQMLSLPPRIALWVSKLQTDIIPEQDHAALKALSERLSILSFRVSELASLRDFDGDETWKALLRSDVKAWRQGVQSAIANLLDDASSINISELQSRLDTRMQDIKKIVAQATRDHVNENTSIEGTVHMQRVLASYRGISIAVLGIAERARTIGWERLTEARL